MPDLPRVEAFLAALSEQTLFKDERIDGSIRSYLTYYRTRAPQRRKMFRAGGFCLLFLSISLPFLTQSAAIQDRAQVASVLSWLVALVGSALSFFNWQQGWQLYMQTQLKLQFALSEWEARTAEARIAASDEEGLAILKEALQRLTKTVNEAVANETAQYFETVKMPAAAK
ncbi:MAG: DUF4231 domain-containing protein [Massilia sp.]